VPEWLKGTDCKSVGFAYVGSNPTPSTIFRQTARADVNMRNCLETTDDNGTGPEDAD
jgi:hypothetical protein